MILIGTAHIDTKGPRRLEDLLAELKPGRITIEMSAGLSLEDIESRILDMRKEYCRIVRSVSIPPALQHFYLGFLSISGYDALVPIQYAQKEGVEVFPVDHPIVAKYRDQYSQRGGDELEANLKVVEQKARDDPSQYAHLEKVDPNKVFSYLVDLYYTDPEKAEEVFDMSQDWSPNTEVTEEWVEKVNETSFAEQRERFMAEEIRMLYPDVHIGGMAHIYDDYGLCVTPLYARLKDIVSRRIKLCEARLP